MSNTRKVLDKAIKLCDSPVTEYRGYTIRKMGSGGGQIAATEKLKQLAKQNGKQVPDYISWYRNYTIKKAKEMVDYYLTASGMSKLV